jgi:hypothetical protein
MRWMPPKALIEKFSLGYLFLSFNKFLSDKKQFNYNSYIRNNFLAICGGADW